MNNFPVQFEALYQAMDTPELESWRALLPEQISHALFEKKHGDLARWQQAIESLPNIKPSSYDLGQPRIRVGEASDIDEQTQAGLEKQLKQLMPWRKGPFEIFGIHINTEWRSDLKWNRLKDSIQPLKGRTVLDVGGGNGYHSWRMRGEGAKLVMNIDPSRLFMMQYRVVQHYLGDIGVYTIPLGIDDVPRQIKAFDTVFSMGVLYHRKSPIDHIVHLAECLRAGGELVLETLVVDGDENAVLLPEKRYAQMNNVWFIPSCLMLERWLRRVGLKNVRVVDISATTVDEQRSTGWMQFQSLSDFLDPEDHSKTVEGYPAPKRATILAEK